MQEGLQTRVLKGGGALKEGLGSQYPAQLQKGPALLPCATVLFPPFRTGGCTAEDSQLMPPEYARQHSRRQLLCAGWQLHLH